MSKSWKQVTVAGCGLVGASFAMALRAADQCEWILGWDSDAGVLDEARARGIIDDVDRTFDRGAQSRSDLIYLATPVRVIIDFFEAHRQIAKPGCLISDSGSTKVEICAAARKYLSPDVLFIGGHPMAGSHVGGIGHARADLFRGATYLLVREPVEREQFATEFFQSTLRAMGAAVEFTTPEEHDRAMAFVSHLPQLLSSALAACVDHYGNRECLSKFVGPAFRDMTRLASSPWNIWQDVLATNGANIDLALKFYIDQLQQIRPGLQTAEVSVPAISSLFTR